MLPLIPKMHPNRPDLYKDLQFSFEEIVAIYNRAYETNNQDIFNDVINGTSWVYMCNCNRQCGGYRILPIYLPSNMPGSIANMSQPYDEYIEPSQDSPEQLDNKN
jgi:hypothetical protein